MPGGFGVQYETAFNGLRLRPFGMVVFQICKAHQEVAIVRHEHPLLDFGGITAQPIFKFYVDLYVIAQNSLSKNHHHHIGALLV